jgi:hypothetical protein
MAALHAAAHELDGDLEIDSEPGRGTRLRMRFPESSVAPRRAAPARSAPMAVLVREESSPAKG